MISDQPQSSRDRKLQLKLLIILKYVPAVTHPHSSKKKTIRSKRSGETQVKRFRFLKIFSSSITLYLDRFFGDQIYALQNIWRILLPQHKVCRRSTLNNRKKNTHHLPPR